jgi:hypothetical protein
LSLFAGVGCFFLGLVRFSGWAAVFAGAGAGSVRALGVSLLLLFFFGVVGGVPLPSSRGFFLLLAEELERELSFFAS